ncbi:MAG: hypothetical protein K2M00_04890 [Muribaculaceae bacterium]|nr:hypothetical protein [Muribaculaceae bacterium]
MKLSKIIITLIAGACVIMFSAQAICKDLTGEHHEKILWVVDGVALTDSVIDFTLEQMRSDSAAVLACSALSFISPHEIDRITVIDSLHTREYGFFNYNGLVEIETSYRRELLVIISFIPYKSNYKFSAGEVLGGYDYIWPIIKKEFSDLVDYGIKDIKIINDAIFPYHQPRAPIFMIDTELPYYRSEKFIGVYKAKSGTWVYELKLNADATYEFSKKNTHKKAIVSQLRNYGIWNISNGNIILIPNHDLEHLHPEEAITLDTINIVINNLAKLSFPKSSWDNKKSLILKRQYDVERK